MNNNWICPKCASQNNPRRNVCWQCGFTRPKEQVAKDGPPTMPASATVRTESIPKVSYCSSCGKQIPESSAFCLHCGTPIGVQASKAPPTWEYNDFVLVYNHRGAWGYSWSTWNIACHYWNGHQAHILTELQKHLDDGWQSISEIGPSGFEVVEAETFAQKLFLSLSRDVIVVEFRVKMRRKSSTDK